MSARERGLVLGVDVRAAMRWPCGIGRYSVELARALLVQPQAPHVLLYGASRRGSRGAERLPADLLAHPRARLFAPRLPARAVAWLARVPGFRTELLTGPLDLFHHTDMIFLQGFRCPEVVMVHDLAYEVSREFHDAGFHERARERMQAAIARARAILAPSESTRADLAGHWGVDPARVTVVPLGGDHVLRTPRGARRDPRPDPSRPYFVHVGTLEPRKNLPRLVRAFRAARRRGLEQDLVLVGRPGWRNEELESELARDPGGAPVFLRGEADESELRAWLEDATALAYPSLYEGFGLPVVEAFHLGVPVLTSALAATREIAGDAARLVDPQSESELAAALLEIGGDAARRAELVRRGRLRAASFTWGRAAAATLALDERLLAR